MPSKLELAKELFSVNAKARELGASAIAALEIAKETTTMETVQNALRAIDEYSLVRNEYLERLNAWETN